MDDIHDILNSQQVKDLLPYLLAGGAAAVAGGAMTSPRRAVKGESRTGYLGRILRNAAIAGTLGAGGAALLRKGFESTVGAGDKVNAITGSEGNEGPLSTGLRAAAFSPLTAGISGASTLAATHGLKGLGAGSDFAKGQLAKLDKGTKLDFGSMNPAQVEQNIAGHHGLIGGISPDVLRRGAGLASGTGIKGLLSRIGHSAPLKTFGTTTGRRVGRGALGLAAAGLPALIGAFLTNDPNAKA